MRTVVETLTHGSGSMRVAGYLCFTDAQAPGPRRLDPDAELKALLRPGDEVHAEAPAGQRSVYRAG